jgi:hypothetical protein
MKPDSTNGSPAHGWGWVLAWWIGGEVIVSILATVIGLEGMVWLLGLSAVVTIVFAMAYGTVRVLRGHDL